MKTYNKLVRDKIPEIIKAEGKELKTRILDDAEYLDALVSKLKEEVAEFEADHSIKELADVTEVIRALMDELGITKDELEKNRAERAESRGAFKDKIFLIEAEE